MKCHGIQVMFLQNYLNVDDIFFLFLERVNIFLYFNTCEVSKCHVKKQFQNSTWSSLKTGGSLKRPPFFFFLTFKAFHFLVTG